MRFFCLLYLLFPLFGFAAQEEDELIASSPEQLAALSYEADTLIGGLVNPLSGHLSLKKTDMVIRGAQNIALTRIFTPLTMPCSFPEQKHNQEAFDKLFLYRHLVQQPYGWHFFPHQRLQFLPNNEVRLTSPSGATLDFTLSDSGSILASSHTALCNVSGDEPSGKYDLRNTRVLRENNLIIVNAPDGTVRIYEKKLLQKEVLPNGKVLKYHHNEQRQLIYVESLDPKERHVYASLRIEGTPKEGRVRFLSSSGMTAEYGYQQRPLHVSVKEKSHKEEFIGFYPPILTEVSSPFYRHESLDYCTRFLLCTYSGKNQLFAAEHAGFGHSPHYRIHKVSFPVEHNGEMHPLYEIRYQPPVSGESDGWTQVKHDGLTTTYHFSKNLLLTSIQTINGSLKKEKIYTWTENQWLKSIEIREGQNTLSKKSYEYDAFGNPTLENFIDLTGSGNSETYTIKRAFSQDGRHLLLKEEHDNGKTVVYSYLPHTNLITEKITQELNTILFRERFQYDDCHNLIQTIKEDAVQTTITNYTLRQEAPFLHMPEWIEEKYCENGSEKLLKRTHLIYDSYGNVARQEIYDAHEQYAYTLVKEYNETGDLLSETNSFGQKASYAYDSKSHCIAETNFSSKADKNDAV